MYFDLPDCRRCCLCVPLRHGILIFGYLNLFFSIFVISIQIWMDISQPNKTSTVLFRGVELKSYMWFYYLLFILELTFNFVLVVGAHLKNTRAISIYYYYGITTTVAAFLTFIVFWPIHRYRDLHGPITLSLSISGLVLQCYLLLLIRAELKKLQYQGGQFYYVNRLTEVVQPLPREEGGTSL